MTSRSATLIAKPPTPTDTEVDYRTGSADDPQFHIAMESMA